MRAAGGKRQKGHIKLARSSATCVTRTATAEWWKVCLALLFAACNDDSAREGKGERWDASIHRCTRNITLYLAFVCWGCSRRGERGCRPAADDDDGERAGVAGEGGGGWERETQCASLWDAESYSSCWEALAPPAHRSSASAPSTTNGGGSIWGWTSQGEYKMPKCKQCWHIENDFSV